MICFSKVYTQVFSNHLMNYNMITAGHRMILSICFYYLEIIIGYLELEFPGFEVFLRICLHRLRLISFVFLLDFQVAFPLSIRSSFYSGLIILNFAFEIA